LYPRSGNKRLDALTDEDVQALKSVLSTKSPKTVNNVLTVLSKLLKVAVKWKVIKTVPCSIELLKVPPPVPKFYEFSQDRALVEAAGKVDRRSLVVTLLGGDAGLRRAEILGLRWIDVDFKRKQLVIEQAVWKGIVDTPKSVRARVVPLTDALCIALQRQRHLRGERVLYRDDGEPVTEKVLRSYLAAAQRCAGLPATGALHILRHTFCSHLAMRGAPPKAIQELAGHEDLSTTLRYMHLSPSAREGAIRLLNRREDPSGFGDSVETAVAES
jgi:integrase